ncbi:MAG: iron chelate uptake ABC transporter family permease subunit [Thermoleophilia bacterium]|nr:iron chelate uptake ABC transporter family permease subunit [Thermoleophilia bacterium]
MTLSSDRTKVYRLVMAVLAAALVAAVLTALVVGAAGLPAAQTFRALGGLFTQGRDAVGDFPSWAPQLLLDLRLPRIVLALVVGAALSTAGATFQGVFRNPLAEPYLLGVSAGAGLGATIAIVVKPLSSLGIYTLPLLAFVGATLAAFLVYRLATFGGQTGGASLLLSGVAVGSTLTAIMSFLMVATESDLHTVVVWLMGGLTTATWTKVYITLPVVGAGFIYMMCVSRRLNLLLMGEERARELGIDSRRTRRNLMIVAALTTAAAVAFSGLIGFIGLMVPHIMRLLVGPDHRRLLPSAALFGALLLLLADTVARTAIAPSEIPVGVITAATGGPFFLYLLRARRGV